MWMYDNANGPAAWNRGNVKTEGITLFHNSTITLISTCYWLILCFKFSWWEQLSAGFFYINKMKHQCGGNGWISRVTWTWILTVISQPGGFNIKNRTLDEFETRHALTLSLLCTLTTERVVAMELRVAMESICSERWWKDSVVCFSTNQGLRWPFNGIQHDVPSQQTWVLTTKTQTHL